MTQPGMDKTLLEAREQIEIAIEEAGRETYRGGHRHWGVYETRAGWEREKQERLLALEADESLQQLKRELETEQAEA